MRKKARNIIAMIFLILGLSYLIYTQRYLFAPIPVSDVQTLDQNETSEYILAKLIYVVDGDTITVLINEEEHKIRLIGIDAPESVNPNTEKNCKEGNIASAFLKEYLSDVKDVYLLYDKEVKDKYGRDLCYVFIKGDMLQEVLLEKGYACIMSIEPNTRYKERFEEIEARAEAENKGFWGSGYFHNEGGQEK